MCLQATVTRQHVQASSVGIVTNLRPEDGGIGVRFLAEIRYRRVRPGSGTHPASYLMGTVESLPAGKLVEDRTWSAFSM
jgi:hypothetical protein